MRVVAFDLIAFAATSNIAAQSLFEGTWQSPTSPGWTFSVTEIVRGMGTALRARVSGCPASPPVGVSELRTNNDVITFKCRSADGTTTIAFTGRRRGETISFTSTVEQQSAKIAPGATGTASSLFPGTLTVIRTGDAQVVANPNGPKLLEFAAAVNRPDLDLKGEAVIAIADSLKELRGVLVENLTVRRGDEPQVVATS